MPDVNYFSSFKVLCFVYYLIIFVSLYFALNKHATPGQKALIIAGSFDVIIAGVAFMIFANKDSTGNDKLMAIISVIIFSIISGYAVKRYVSLKDAKTIKETWKANSYRVFRTSHPVITTQTVVVNDRWYIEKDGTTYEMLVAPKFDENTAPQIKVRITGNIVEIENKKEWYNYVLVAQLIFCLIAPILAYLMYKNGLRTDDYAHPVDISLPVMSLFAVGLLWLVTGVLTQNDSFSKFFRSVFFVFWVLVSLEIPFAILQNLKFLIH